MNSTSVLPKSKYNAQKIALDWISKGIRPVPLRPRSKRPNAGEGWNKLRINKDQVSEYFRPPDNVGALWGLPSGWLIDIDIDNEIACKLAPLMLPETFIYGRTDRPASHYVYRCKGVKTVKCRTRELETIVEIRSTGTQSVLPPCRHPDGGVYRIDNEIDFADIEPSVLTRAVESLAAATVLVQRYPGAGGRHDYVHAVTGALLSCGWKADRIIPFMGCVLAVATDADGPQRARTVRNTIDHFNKKDRIYGWNTLSTWIDEPEIKALQAWIGGFLTVTMEATNPGKTPLLDGAEKEYLAPLAAKKTPMDKFDYSWMQVPGMVGELIKYCERRSQAQQPIFNLAAALMSMALMTQNRYWVTGWETPLQPYFMLVAPPSGGKDSGLKMVSQIARKLGLEEYLYSGFQSYHSMLDRLSQPPSIGVWLWDEAARFLKNSSKNMGSPEFGMLSQVMSVYGQAATFMPAIPARKTPIPRIEHPFFLVMGAAQPQLLTTSLSNTDVMTGLINRFVLFDSGSHFPPSNPDRQAIFPSTIIEYHQSMKSMSIPGGDHPFIQIQFDSNDTWLSFREYEEKSRKKSFSDENSLWSRANQNALMLAGIVAVGIDIKKPRISMKIAEWAQGITSWSCECWEYRLQKSSIRNITEGYSKRVEEVIRSAKSLGRSGRYRQGMVDWLSKGWVPRSVLSRQCREIRGKELDEILSHLVDMDLITSGESENGGVIYAAKD